MRHAWVPHLSCGLPGLGFRGRAVRVSRLPSGLGRGSSDPSFPLSFSMAALPRPRGCILFRRFLRRGVRFPTLRLGSASASFCRGLAGCPRCLCSSYKVGFCTVPASCEARLGQAKGRRATFRVAGPSAQRDRGRGRGCAVLRPRCRRRE